MGVLSKKCIYWKTMGWGIFLRRHSSIMEVHFLILHSTSTWPVPQRSSGYLCKITSLSIKKTVSQAEQQPYGTTKRHWETIGIPKNAYFKVNPYWSVDYKMNTMWVKMFRIESLETQDKPYSHVLMLHNFMANCSHHEKIQSIYCTILFVN